MKNRILMAIIGMTLVAACGPTALAQTEKNDVFDTVLSIDTRDMSDEQLKQTMTFLKSTGPIPLSNLTTNVVEYIDPASLTEIQGLDFIPDTESAVEMYISFISMGSPPISAVFLTTKALLAEEQSQLSE